MLNSMYRATGCDHALLGKLIKNSGKRVRQLARDISTPEEKVSATLLWRLASNSYGFIVSENKRRLICDHFGVDEDVLFPFVGAKEVKAS